MAERWVLVTGGTRRLGRAFAFAFAHAGWHVVCHHRASRADAEATAADIAAAGQRCLTVAADLADPTAAGRLIPDLPDAVRAGLRCVVNNASLFEADTGADMDAALLDRHWRINTVAPLLLAQALHRLCQGRAEPGCAIHVLDQKVHNLNPDYFSYTLSKLALERAVGLQAQALAPHLRVCGLSPGLSFVSGPQTDENFARASRVNLLRRPLDPDDVARAAVHLAENPALNGCVLPADNGQHQLGLARDVMHAVDLGLAP